MRSEELFDIIGEIDENKVLRAGNTVVNKKTHLKWITIAACLCLAFTVAVLFFNNSEAEKISVPSNHTSTPPTHEATSRPTPEVTSTVISYHPGGEKIETSYAAPDPGEYFCFVEVTLAREYYKGQNVDFLLFFDMFKADGGFSEEERNAEYKRLSELGYRLYETERWTYRADGEKVVLPIVVGLFSEEELASFDANPDYGYAFRFVINGDGSSISFDENLVTRFDACTIE